MNFFKSSNLFVKEIEELISILVGHDQRDYSKTLKTFFKTKKFNK